MGEKTVLCVCQGRKRPVTFLGSYDSIEEDRKRLKKEIESVFSDLLKPPSGEEGEVRGYFIEKESKEWGGLIDLTGFVQDKDILHLNWSEAHMNSKDPSEVMYYSCLISYTDVSQDLAMQTVQRNFTLIGYS